MKPARILALALVASLVGLVACSDDDEGGSTGSTASAASSCAEAKKVADECNAKPQDGGAQVTVTFDQAKCESSGDQGKKAADCIVANRSNCDCLAKCAISGSCS